MRRARSAMFAAGVLAAMIATACGDGPPGGSSTSTGAAFGTVASAGTKGDKTVNETDALVFAPTEVTVKVGQTVQWTNAGSVTHNVTFTDNADLASGSMAANATFAIKFSTPGDYKYTCTIHAPSMAGTVHVTG